MKFLNLTPNIFQDESPEQPSISSHTPDFTITVDRSQSLVLVTLLGTRMFPNPSVCDVVMDLRAELVPFLGGEAHSGMVIGMRNIMDKSFPVIKETLEKNPGYSILVVGYSLGKIVHRYFLFLLLSNYFTFFRIRSGSVVRRPAADQ